MPPKKRVWTEAQLANKARLQRERRDRNSKNPVLRTIEFFSNEEEERGGMTVDRAGLLRQRFKVPEAVQHLLTERQRTVLKGKVRMSRGWVRMEQIMKETGMTMEEFVAQLSVEELVKGKFRNVNGHMQGRAPKFVPREFQQACLKELMTRGQEMWLTNYHDAIKAMTDIASGRGIGVHATPGERIKAAQFVVERMEGKVPERLVVSQDQPWQTVLDGIVAEVPDEAVGKGRMALERANAGIVEGEVLEVDFDEEPDPQPVRSRRRKPR